MKTRLGDVQAQNQDGERAWHFLLSVMNDSNAKMEHRIQAAAELSRCDDIDKAVSLLSHNLDEIAGALNAIAKGFDGVSNFDGRALQNIAEGLYSKDSTVADELGNVAAALHDAAFGNEYHMGPLERSTLAYESIAEGLRAIALALEEKKPPSGRDLT